MNSTAVGPVADSGEGNVSYDEFFEWLDEPRSLFTDLLYDRIVGTADCEWVGGGRGGECCLLLVSARSSSPKLDVFFVRS